MDLQLWGAYSAGFLTMPTLWVAYRLAREWRGRRRCERQQHDYEVQDLQRELLETHRQLERARRRKK